MSFPHLFLERENANMQLFLSEQLRLLFISWSAAFNQSTFSALHFSQAEYATVLSNYWVAKGSFTQKNEG